MADTRLARAELPLGRWTEPEWHKLWLGLRSRRWLTLALVPASKNMSTDLTLRTAVLLSKTGATHLRSPIHVADATTITLSTLATLSEELAQCRQSGAPVLIALPSVTENPAALSVAHEAEAVLLCVVREQTRVAEIKATVTDVGSNRFVGSVVFRGGE